MRILASLSAAAVVLVLASCGGDKKALPAAAPDGQKPKSGRVLGFLWNQYGSGDLARLNPLTLAPSGRQVDVLAGGGSATAFSPDHGTLAIGSGEEASIQLVDVERMRSLGVVSLGLRGWVTMLSWQRGSLFAVVNGEADRAVAVVDPVGRKVLRRHRLAGPILQAQPGPGTVVLLVGPAEGIGPVDLTVIGGKGMASVRLQDIAGGFAYEHEDDDLLTRDRTPGLAVDTTGRRAVVVPAGRTVAEVSLNNLSVSYHTLSEPVSLLERLRNWFEPAAYAKFMEGPVRRAIWVGDGLVAVTGADYSTVTDADEERRIDARAAGVSLIDTRDWSIRTVNEEATEIALVESTLLAFGVPYYTDAAPKGFGLVGYDLGGDERFSLFEGTGVGWIEVVGGYAYVTTDGKRFTVVDVAGGRIVAQAKTERGTTLVVS